MITIWPSCTLCQKNRTLFWPHSLLCYNQSVYTFLIHLHLRHCVCSSTCFFYISLHSSSLLTQALTMRPHLGGKGILTEILKRCCSNGRSTDIILVGQRALQRSLKGACAGGPVGKTLHSQRPGPSLILGWGTVSYLPQWRFRGLQIRPRAAK